MFVWGGGAAGKDAGAEDRAIGLLTKCDRIEPGPWSMLAEKLDGTLQGMEAREQVALLLSYLIHIYALYYNSMISLSDISY